MHIIIFYLFTYIGVFGISLHNDFVPPGTLNVDGIFVQHSEVTNSDYLEYLFFQKQQLDSISYQKLLPDSANFWYHQDKFQNYPIVYISHDQAIAYCQWKSEIISKKYNQKVKYRLPTQGEWERVAKYLIKNNKRKILKELKKTVRMIHRNPDDYVIKPTTNKNKEVYQLFDNVSEMTNTHGIAMGGNNYYLTDLRSNINRVMHFSKPNAYIGFRCIAEIK